MLAKLGLSMSDIAAVGLCTPGTMDIPAASFWSRSNLPHWHYFPIRDCVAEAFSKPVSFANDANAAAYGEFWVGSGCEYHSIVLSRLAWASAAASLLAILSIDGENSDGSECGHIIVDSSPTVRMCGCGQPGAFGSLLQRDCAVARTHELISQGRSDEPARRSAKLRRLRP